MGILEKINVEGRVESCLIGPDRKAGLEKARCNSLRIVFDGIAGDCHSSRIMASDSRTLKQYAKGTPIVNNRQVSIVSVEELALIAIDLGIPEVLPEWVGANLLVSHVPDFTLLPPSTRMMFSSGATLIVDLENQPCRYPADVIERYHPGHGSAFPKVATHRRGIVARVEREGLIRIGNSIRLFIPPQRIYRHAKPVPAERKAR